MRCAVCTTERATKELLVVRCLPHAGAHTFHICRPSIDRQDRVPENCFRRGTASAAVHTISLVTP